MAEGTSRPFSIKRPLLHVLKYPPKPAEPTLPGSPQPSAFLHGRQPNTASRTDEILASVD